MESRTGWVLGGGTVAVIVVLLYVVYDSVAPRMVCHDALEGLGAYSTSHNGSYVGATAESLSLGEHLGVHVDLHVMTPTSAEIRARSVTGRVSTVQVAPGAEHDAACSQ